VSAARASHGRAATAGARVRRAAPARATAAPELEVRAAKRTDVEALVDLSLRAYRVSSAEARRDFYTDHPRFELKDVRVGTLGDELVASLVLYSFHAHVRGERLPVTGIGSVAVSPEHRRRGIADALLRSTLSEMRERGVDTKPYLPAIHLMSFYRERFGHREGEFPVCEDVAARSVALPFFPAMTESQVERVAAAFTEAVGQGA